MDKLDESWRDIETIAVYGFGKTAKGSIDYLINEFQVSAIIDNNEKYESGIEKYRGIPVVNWDAFDNTKNGKEKIIILAAGKALNSIKDSLNRKNKIENVDYTDMDTFFGEWYWRFQGKIHIGKITTSVTTRCTFNCKYCNMLMPYYKNPHDYSYEMLCADADKLFSLVDYVSAFVIIGGEPFLYGDLNKYLLYLGKEWGGVIGNIQLITNGSVMPSSDLMDTIKKYNVEVRISDYSDTVPYSKRLFEFLSLLEKNEIKYVVFEQKEWIDFGYPHDDVNMGNTSEELRQHMLKCHGMCHWLHKGRYYYCSNAWSAQECGLFNLKKENDYLELTELIKDTTEGKKKLLDFYKGNLPESYMSFCRVCRGFESSKIVKAGIQIPRI